MTPVPTLRCKCGFTGPIYSFCTVNGRTSCVICAGSKREKPSARQVRDMNRGKRGKERGSNHV